MAKRWKLKNATRPTGGAAKTLGPTKTLGPATVTGLTPEVEARYDRAFANAALRAETDAGEPRDCPECKAVGSWDPQWDPECTECGYIDVEETRRLQAIEFADYESEPVKKRA